jgi:hypothetical protein
VKEIMADPANVAGRSVASPIQYLRAVFARRGRPLPAAQYPPVRCRVRQEVVW